MSVLTIIKESVESLSDGFNFLYAGHPEQNLNNDALFPVAYLMPLSSLDKATLSVIEASYQVAIYLGQLSNPEWTLLEHENNCIDAMRQASVKLIVAFQKDNRIRIVKLKKRDIVINKDDVNTSGIWLECELVIVESAPIC